MTLGEKIKYYREKQNIGQEHLAELAHLSVSTIRKYESGERKPKEEQLEKIAFALQINPAALKDYNYDEFLEVVPSLFGIGVFGDIEFIGEKNSAGFYQRDSFGIKFNNRDIMEFLLNWAYKKEEIDGVKKAASLIKDDESQRLMEERIKELTSDLEKSLVFETISEGGYYEDELPENMIPDKIKEETPSLDSYIQIIDSLYRLALIMDFDCVGVWERAWNPKAIITFDLRTVNGRMSEEEKEAFGRFVFYYEECRRVGIITEGFSFQNRGNVFYRYKIKDRTVASAVSLINEVLDFPWGTATEKEKKAFRADIEARMKEFDKPIESIW